MQFRNCYSSCTVWLQQRVVGFACRWRLSHVQCCYWLIGADWRVALCECVYLRGSTPQFLVGTPPFLADQYEATYRRISRVDVQFPSEPQLSPEAKDLIQCMLRKNPEKRMKLDQLHLHPFITKMCPPSQTAPAAAAAPVRAPAGVAAAVPQQQ